MIKSILLAAVLVAAGGPAGGDQNAGHVCLTNTNWIAAEETADPERDGDAAAYYAGIGRRLGVLAGITTSRSLAADLAKGRELSRKAAALSSAGKSTTAIDKRLGDIETRLLAYCA
ncbi:hypothetical protein [Nonomuraea typhae]|uniref:hypothetical protein n=1 Tax=Nonomuraea typhae TaxID=2603600 RepID=UPI0012FB9BDB|nr:hypothetical protein [Nonomuraea typhae]